MGYTNYWNQFRDFTDEEWAKIKNQVEYVYEVMPQIVVSGDTCDGRWHTLQDREDYISFNGVGEAGHEDFVLSKKQNLSPNDIRANRPYAFNCCKTAGKPYDLGVWYLLTWIYHNTDNAIAISRDRVGETSTDKESAA